MNQSTFEQNFPSFFAEAPAVTVRDPLAQFLGAARGGVMEYRYADAVRLAGHSCPTVAGAWLMTIHGLRALYGDELPVRGEIEVFMADARDAGTTGVVATVAQLVTGAAPETGFHGIGGRFGVMICCISISRCRGNSACAARIRAQRCRWRSMLLSCPGRTKCACFFRKR